jgi:Uncharacterised nucleotidyltransferase
MTKVNPEELGAVRACLAVALISERYGGESPAAVERFSWDELARTSIRNGIGAEVFSGAKVLGLSDLADRLRKPALRTAMRTMHLARETSDLHRDLNHAGIDNLVLKGAATGLLTRRNFTTRPSSDIDLLVAPADLRHVHQVLLERGHALSSSSPMPDDGSLTSAAFRRLRQEVQYEGGLRPIDLHWQVGFNRMWLPSTEEAFADAVELTFPGGSLRSLHIDKALALAALHWRYERYRGMKSALDVLALSERASMQVPRVAAVQDGVRLARVLAGDSATTTVDARVVRWFLDSQTSVTRSRFAARRRRLFDHFAVAGHPVDAMEVPARALIGPMLRARQRLRRPRAPVDYSIATQ